MSRVIHSRQEKRKLYKKLMITIVAVAAFCIVLAMVFRVIDRQKLRAQQAYETELGVVTLNGKKYVPKKNIETYLFMGIDSYDKVEKVTDYDGGHQNDVLILMVLDISAGTFKTMAINRNTITNVKSLDLDNSYLGETEMQIALAHSSGDGLEASCENTVDAVSEYLHGQEIDGYAAVNMGAIGTINHMAGGVTVTIEDDFSEIDPDLKQGETICLTDKQAEEFIHDRWGVADETNENRMHRQSVYMTELKRLIKEKCQQSSTYPLDLYESVQDYMVTSINKSKFSKLALLVAKEKDEGEVSVDGTVGTDELGYATFEPNEQSLEAAIAELFYEEYEE